MCLTCRLVCMLFLLFLSDILPAFAKGVEAAAIVHTTPSRSTQFARNATLSTDLSLAAAGSLDAARITEVPGAFSSHCNYGCVAYCQPNDAHCIAAASAAVQVCSPSWKQWRDWLSASYGPNATLPSAWTVTTITSALHGGKLTTTVDEYTSFSTVDQTFFRQAGSTTGFQPVYALGSPITVTTVSTFETFTITSTLSPTPKCKFSGLVKANPSITQSSTSHTSTAPACGNCTLTGGTVNLFFWPPAPTATGNFSIAANAVRSAVVDDLTMYSPTVYISLRTVYASNDCFQVGARHTGTVVAMDPDKVSTQNQLGGMAWDITYGQLNYNDLIGPPPLTQYMEQETCIMAPCTTIYSTDFRPTLVVPPQIRSMDPAWGPCALGLEGLYDPPVALTAQEAKATAVAASPGIAHSPDAATETWTAFQPSTTARSEGSSPVTTSQAPAATRSQSAEDPTFISRAHGPIGISSAAVVNGETLGFGTVKTMGSGPSATTMSLVEQSGSTYVVYGHTATTVVLPSIVSTHTSRRSSTLQSTLSSEQTGGYTIGSLTVESTLKLGSPVTLNGAQGSVTLEMLTYSSSTFIEVGTTATLAFGSTHKSVQISSHTTSANLSYLAFTKAPDGNFVLHGTTLISGEPITVGTGSAKTTLRMTTQHGTPAIVLDGKTTELLGHPTISASSDPPSISNGPSLTRAATGGSFPWSSTSVSTSAASHSRALDHASFTLIMLLLGCIAGV